jgi:glycosyltransferase involved in cell wall biosynthesis
VRVSILIPTRDHARHLGQAIASALAQDLDGLEVLVHDDASSDETGEVIAGFADPRIRALRHREPIGVAANRDSLLAAARGEYVAWLDSDDVRQPGTLRRQLELLDGHPQAVLVHGGYTVIDDDGRELPTWPVPFADDTLESSAVALEQLAAANEIATSTAIVRRSAHRTAGRFAHLASSSDWDMWLRLAALGSVAYRAGVVASYRQHGSSISRTAARGGVRLRCNAEIVRRLRRRMGQRLASLAEAGLAAQAVLYAGDAYTRGAVEEAQAALTLAAQLVPCGEIEALRREIRGGEATACMMLTRTALGSLADALAGTRYGVRIAAAAAGDPSWDAQLARAGRAAARVTPPDAVLAAIAKWDPQLIERSGRSGCNFPDRRLLPDGYPRDGESALAHLHALRANRGVTHLVVPDVSRWWLEHYPELARGLGAPLWSDADVEIFTVGAPA